MPFQLLQTCVSFQPAEQSCWEVLLRESGLGVAMPESERQQAMRRSLRTIWILAAGGAPEDAAREHRALARSEFRRDECGLEALQGYLEQGRRAVLLVLTKIERTHPECHESVKVQVRHRIDAAFGVLAELEVDALCRGCDRLTHCERRREWPAARWPVPRPAQ